MPYDISYEYDATGNRLRKVDNLTAAVTTYAYDAANQLKTEQAAAGTTTYTFDRAGNIETITTPFSDVTTYVWDAENRRTAVQTSGGTAGGTKEELKGTGANGTSRSVKYFDATIKQRYHGEP